MNPVIRAILADPGVDAHYQSALRRAEESKNARRAQYEADLQKMDWQFEHSDDQRVWRAGRDELQRLRDERFFLDKDHTIWRKHAPVEYRFG